jgi:hypothetical protein
MGPPGDDDATVVLRRPATPAKRRGRGILVGTALLALLAGLLGVWALRPRPVPPPAPVVPPPAAPAPAATAPAPFAIVTADEATIRDHVAESLTVFRFAPAPDIVVLDFPTLRMQGEMLNRVAALVEKAGLPRDRVLTDAELDAAIRAGGDTVETFYYGHDYPAAALARFFALADAGHVALNAEEARLRALLDQLGWLRPEAKGALISVPRIPQPAAPTLDRAARATMLHHELSHGLFFTDPTYADYVRRFWEQTLTAAERDAVRRFLGGEGYDTTDEPLMYNEMQAYLVFTVDARFFAPANIGMTPARRDTLRAAFLRDMPPSWLKEDLKEDLAREAAAR